MKYSYNLLKKLSGTKKKPDELAGMISLKGFEFEGSETLVKRFDGFVVGEILDFEKHPNADRLRLVKVNVGTKILNIVCGADNFQKGDKVPVALVGAIIPLNKIKIEKRQVRGQWSEGMICAEDELGLGKDHQGIMILDKKLENGTKLVEALELEDETLEFSILPNRAHDVLSYQGMAREIAAMEGRKVEFLTKKIKEKRKDLKIKIEKEKLCPRYLAGVFDNIKIGPAPNWMKSVLIASGMEPINNVVDITNYAMLVTGGPLHAFDYQKIFTSDKKEIVVRQAKQGEHLELLGDKFIVLDKNDLLITSGDKALALAGIKGGKYSGIDRQTNKIVLESANFNMLAIRRSRQRYGILTESQLRFEKGLSPMIAESSFLLAAELLEKYAGAKLVEVVDKKHYLERSQTVCFDLNKLNSLIGQPIEMEKALKILDNLGFKIAKKTKEKIEFLVPAWRLDIEGSEDLYEEVARIVGYENIRPQELETIVAPAPVNESRNFEWSIKDRLIGLGFDEVINYSFLSQKELNFFDLKSDYTVQNPLSADQEAVRSTLLLGLAKNARTNASHFDDFEIFELGRVYSEKASDEQSLKISGLAFSRTRNEKDLFYQTKSKLEVLLSDLEIEFHWENQMLNDKIFTVGQTGKLVVSGKEAGFFGMLNDKLKNFYKIKGRAVAFELDFSSLLSMFKKQKVFQPLRKYPVVARDLSFFVPVKVAVTTIEKIIRRRSGEKLITLELFDIFDKVGEKSLSFHLTFGLNNRTLEGDEADNLIKEIITDLEKIGARLRS